MLYNPNLFNTIRTQSGKEQTSTPTQPDRLYGRVVSIVLTEDDEDYKTEGRQLALNGIRYEPYNFSLEKSEDTEYPFAYSFDAFLNSIPEIDEIVEILIAPSDANDVGGNSSKTYYKNVVNIWNNPNHNARPNKITGDEEAELGDDVIENSEISNLTAFPGDFIIGGRHGNSLRLGGNNHEKNIFTDNTNNGKPFAIFRVGVNTTGDSFLSHVEDVNKDYSSLYLMSDHIIPTIQGSSKLQDTYDTPPISLNSYKGPQALLDSGRVVLHADTDHLLLNSANSIGNSSKTFNVDSSEYIRMNSRKIQLGIKDLESAVKGEKLEDLLNNLIEMLKNLGNTLKSCTTPSTTSVALPIAGELVIAYSDIIEGKLLQIKSKKVFIE